MYMSTNIPVILNVVVTEVVVVSRESQEISETVAQQSGFAARLVSPRQNW